VSATAKLGGLTVRSARRGHGAAGRVPLFIR
jgi:hypothetical protein